MCSVAHLQIGFAYSMNMNYLGWFLIQKLLHGLTTNLMNHNTGTLGMEAIKKLRTEISISLELMGQQVYRIYYAAEAAQTADEGHG